MNELSSGIVHRSRQSVWRAISVEEAMFMIEEHVSLTDRTHTVVIAEIKTKNCCDMKLCEILLPKGCVISAAEIGILAASERKFVRIYQKPKVAVISTGYEDQYGIQKSRPQFIASLKENNFKHVDIGILPDKKEKIEEGLKTVLVLCDVIACLGGVSMGEKIEFGRVMMKPGLPTTFAYGKWSNGEKFVFALPGNPVSTWVTAQLFLLPALKKIAGWEHYQHTVISVRLNETIKLDRRSEYRRTCLLPDSENIPQAICLAKEQMSS